MAFKQEWKYEEDTGSVMAKCPICDGRMLIHIYQYQNPYHFCPYCGIKLGEGNIKAARKRTYGGIE